jgi:hypothetical protein
MLIPPQYSQLAELTSTAFKASCSTAGGLDGLIVHPDPQHSHGLVAIPGVEDNRRAKWDYRNGTGMGCSHAAPRRQLP